MPKHDITAFEKLQAFCKQYHLMLPDALKLNQSQSQHVIQAIQVLCGKSGGASMNPIDHSSHFQYIINNPQCALNYAKLCCQLSEADPTALINYSALYKTLQSPHRPRTVNSALDQFFSAAFNNPTLHREGSPYFTVLARILTCYYLSSLSSNNAATATRAQNKMDSKTDETEDHTHKGTPKP